MDDDWSRNRRGWDAYCDEYQRLHGAQLTANPQAWGVWSLPESEVRLLGDVRDRDVLEFGCGAAQWSIALAQRGARCTGLDNSARQLDHARAAAAAAGVDVRLVHAPAEDPPFADASFDIVFCDHGALSFTAPETTIPQAARLLRSGGILAFSTGHPLREVCWDPVSDLTSRRLHHAYFGLGAIVDPADGIVSHVRTIAAYVAIIIGAGFTLEQLLEPQPPPHARSTYAFIDLEWARAYPAEVIFRARKGAARPTADSTPDPRSYRG